MSEIEAHTAAPERVFAAVPGLGILRSGDSGVTFAPASRGVDRLFQVTRIDTDPRNPDVALAGGIVIDATTGGWSLEGRILLTDDGGGTWREVASEGGRVYEIRRCVERPDVVLAARHFGLYASMDGGRSFVRIDARSAWGVDVAPDCSSIVAFLVGGSDMGAFVSHDGGSRFEPLPREGLGVGPGLRGVGAMRFATGGTVLVGTHAGLHVLTPGNDAFQRAPGFVNLSFTTFRSTRGNLWAGTWGSGAYVLEDGAGRWQRLEVEGVVLDHIMSVTPRVDGRLEDEGLLVGSWGHLYAKRGERFEVVSSSGSPLHNVLDAIVTGSGTVLVGSQISGVHRSVDGGLSFTPSNEGLEPWTTAVGPVIDARAFALDPRDDSVVLLGTNGRGIFRSTDDGVRWAPTNVTDEVVPIVRARGSSLIAIASGDGVLASDDGIAWRLENDGLASLDVVGLAVDGETAFAAAGGVVYRSDAPGEPWIALESACDLRAGRLAVVERVDGRWLYATDGGNGVVRQRLGAPGP